MFFWSGPTQITNLWPNYPSRGRFKLEWFSHESTFEPQNHQHQLKRRYLEAMMVSRIWEASFELLPFSLSSQPWRRFTWNHLISSRSFSLFFSNSVSFLELSRCLFIRCFFSPSPSTSSFLFFLHGLSLSFFHLIDKLLHFVLLYFSHFYAIFWSFLSLSISSILMFSLTQYFLHLPFLIVYLHSHSIVRTYS